MKAHMAHACRGPHWSILSRLASDDFPDRFTHGPPLCGYRCTCFAFESVMRFEAKDAAMQFKGACCPTIRTFHQAGTTFLKRLEGDFDLSVKRTFGRFGRWRAISHQDVCFRRVRCAV